jgi:hypothetical protein
LIGSLQSWLGQCLKKKRMGYYRKNNRLKKNTNFSCS